MEKRGDPVPGSRYVRDYCAECGEPIRVAEALLAQDNYCGDCKPTGSMESLPGFHEVGEKLHLGRPEDINNHAPPLKGKVEQVIK